MNNAPIGVFDSGVGGISVLKQLVKLLPNENYIFYGDSANAPYGTKIEEEVLELSLSVFKNLMSEGVKAVVIACNTATSVALDVLRKSYPQLSVIGIEPAVKPAVKENPGGRIVVMATEITLKREKFLNVVDRYSDRAELISMPCPELVNFVEDGKIDTPEVKLYLQERFELTADRNADAVVLGCTHFPFLIDSIREVAGSQAKFYDGSNATARELAEQLSEKGIKAYEQNKGRIKFLSSAGRESLALSRKLFEL